MRNTFKKGTKEHEFIKAHQLHLYHIKDMLTQAQKQGKPNVNAKFYHDGFLFAGTLFTKIFKEGKKIIKKSVDKKTQKSKSRVKGKAKK